MKTAMEYRFSGCVKLCVGQLPDHLAGRSGHRRLAFTIPEGVLPLAVFKPMVLGEGPATDARRGIESRSTYPA
jgi:hypothetical protein